MLKVGPMGSAAGLRLYTLWVHDERFSKQDVVINPDLLNFVERGDLLEIYHPRAESHPAPQHLAITRPNEGDTTAKGKRLIVQVTALDSDIISKQPQLQISVAQHVAVAFDLLPRTTVVVRKVEKSAFSADFMELSFRDQYIGRSDMWKLKTSLNNTCIHVGKKVTSLGVRAQVKELVISGRSVPCAYITEHTRTIYRSESAKYFIFIQMSKEMWEFDDDGELYFEKCVNGFLPELFESWKRTGTNHVVSIVLFARIFYKEAFANAGETFSETPLSTDPQGRFYRDFYRVVVDWETRSDWSQVLIPLKREFIVFQKHVLQRFSEDGSTTLSGVNSPASEGNVLEAINLALNPFDKHYIDRDLLRTGLSVVIITPSPGIFEVDRKLYRLTTQRMIDNGIGCDVVSLSRPPLYAVPLFQFIAKDCSGLKDTANTVTTLSGSGPDISGGTDSNTDRKAGESEKKSLDVWDPLFSDDAPSDVPDKIFFTIPGWIEMSFYSRGSISSSDRFKFRCKVNELQNLSLEISSSLIVDYLDKESFDTREDLGESDLFDGNTSPYDKYDEAVFTIGKKGAKRSDDKYRTALPSESAAPGSVSSASNIRGSSTNGAIIPDSASRGNEFSNEAGIRASKSYITSKYDTSAGNAHAILIQSASRGSEREGLGRDSMNRMSYSGSEPFKYGTSPNTDVTKRASPGRYTHILPRSTHNARQNYINPCNPSKNVIRVSSHTRRWQHVYPNLAFHPHKSDHGTKWKSLSTPACLPLTTDYFPSAEDLQALYIENTYTVTPADDLNMYQDDSGNELQRVESLLSELISQRLQQGFQLIVSNSLDGAQKLPVGGNLVTDDALSPTGPIVSKFWSGRGASKISTLTPYFLSLGDHVHRLFFDSYGKNVEVKRYMRNVNYNTDSYQYSCSIWPEHSSEYSFRTFNFAYSELATYNWNYLDHLISGYMDEMTDNLRYWRTRFLLIPLENAPQINVVSGASNDNFDDEELRLAAFNRFLEFIEKSRWLHPMDSIARGDSKKGRRKTGINVQFSTLNTSAYVREEILKASIDTRLDRRGSIGDLQVTPTTSESLTRSSPLNFISASLQHPITGILIKDRKWHFILYENVFIGSECVDWIVANFVDIESREDAVEFGNELLNTGLFEHANRKHRFLDGHYFYRIGREFKMNREVAKEKDVGNPAGQGWFRNAAPRPVHVEPPTEALASNVFTQKPKVELEKRLIIDLDLQKRSSRRELAFLYYDTVHNPRNSYHFQLHWLVCTPRLIEDLLISWSRVAEKCGLKLVEAPVEQATGFSNDNPFQGVIPIPLAVPPPTITPKEECQTFPDQWFEMELLKRQGFLLDVESDAAFPQNSIVQTFQRARYTFTQFVHRSGTAFVQILEDGKGFLWVNNRLHLTASTTSTTWRGGAGSGGGPGISLAHAAAHPAHSMSPDFLRKSMTAYCQDEKALTQLWSELSALRSSTPATLNLNFGGPLYPKESRSRRTSTEEVNTVGSVAFETENYKSTSPPSSPKAT
ncbi:vacuolar membrane-associated protein iml1 [Dinochytrium kinnereticum]|nr:vacuolar membrane-associated protein iml1 [Dinochytrium kinnereticum]